MKNVLKLVMALGLVSSQLFALVPPQGTRNPKVEVKAPVVVAPVIEVVEEAPVVVAPAVVVKPAAKGLLAKFKALSTAQKVAVVAGAAVVTGLVGTELYLNEGFTFKGKDDKLGMPSLTGKGLLKGSGLGVAVRGIKAKYNGYVLNKTEKAELKTLEAKPEAARTDEEKAKIVLLKRNIQVRENLAKVKNTEETKKAVTDLDKQYDAANTVIEKEEADALKALKVEQLKAFVKIKDLSPALKDAADAELKALDVVLKDTDSLPEANTANGSSGKEQQK